MTSTFHVENAWNVQQNRCQRRIRVEDAAFSVMQSWNSPIKSTARL